MQHAAPFTLQPTFDGYPYLITRIVGGFYHVMPFPAERSTGELRELAHRQHRANRLEAVLCLGPRDALAIGTGGSFSQTGTPPTGGRVFGGYLQPCENFPPTPEMLARIEALELLTEAVKARGGTLLGDRTKGGRDATSEDLRRLAGFAPTGAPRGLERCDACQEWRGECLDPSPLFRGKMMRVHCICQNDNRCARCWGLLAGRKLNANEYDEKRKVVLHQPGFSALGHQCAEGSSSMR